MVRLYRINDIENILATCCAHISNAFFIDKKIMAGGGARPHGPNPIQTSVCLATMVVLGWPPWSSGQKLCVKKPSGSYLRFTSHSRYQLSPKEPFIRWCDSCMPKNWRFTVLNSGWQTRSSDCNIRSGRAAHRDIDARPRVYLATVTGQRRRRGGAARTRSRLRRWGHSADRLHAALTDGRPRRTRLLVGQRRGGTSMLVGEARITRLRQ
ncbi:hypothetical protein JB92DRAFT_2208751 [Gautieria morchelliformis]|nr:hypothetical protein JB92DRAFT_2208751 [Gautieria morchelliformis]